MNKKLREKLDSWDLKSVFLTIAFLSIGLFIFFYFADIRDRLRTEDKKKFKGEAKGEIISVEKQDRISQSKWNGTKIYVDNYKVTYKFTVNGQIFEHIDIIPATTKNQNLLNELLEIKENKTCSVKFDTDDPTKSTLIKSE